MGADDDIAAALPRAPFPAPARREAAIAAALRRFDGLGDAEAGPADRRSAPAAAWRRRPALGALAGAALVALVAVPLAWTSLDQQPYREARETRPAATRPAGGDGPAMADATGAPLPPAPLARSGAAAPADPAAAPGEAPVPAPAEAEKPAPEPVSGARPPMPAEPATSPPQIRTAIPDSARSEELVVTGSRVRRPDLGAAEPLEANQDSAIVVSGLRAASARSARLGDWNACTVEDPRRSLGRCRASPPLADGLERAWQGDWEGAIRAFDAAIAAAPRSAPALINRGIAHRRSGELDRALADLDRAVRFSPRAARGYYHRSLVLRQRGDLRRARADEARAVELDPRYAAVVPAGR